MSEHVVNAMKYGQQISKHSMLKKIVGCVYPLELIPAPLTVYALTIS